MKHISLFSGIGGFDLAAQWAGWDNLASCEINPFGRRHLAYYWPEAYHHDDIKTLTGEIIEHEAKKRYGPDWRADGVILSGGFPCQPYSLAGKRLGKEDERHLWPEMLRVIREIKPDWIVGENVFGLVNWSDGLVFDEVQADLETAGYEVQAFVLPACAADAPHRRDRVWIVANSIDTRRRQNWECGSVDRIRNARENHKVSFAKSSCISSICKNVANTNGNGQQRSNGKHEVNASEGGQYAQRDAIEGAEYGDATYAANIGQEQPWNTRERRSGLEDSRSYASRNDANTNGNGQQRSNGKHEVNASEGGQYAQRDAIEGAEYGVTAYANRERHEKRNTATESIQPERQHSKTNFEREQRDWHNFPTQSPVCSRDDGFSGRLDGITFSKWRNESIKAAGNAIVPQIAYRIFETINIFTQHNTHGAQFEQTNLQARARARE